MNNGTRKADDVRSFSLPTPPFSEVHASQELREPRNAARLKLFRILRKAGQILDAELCPNNPKSICTKACDLSRNLPHWQDHVGQLILGDGSASDLTREYEVVEDVLKAVNSTIEALSPMVTVWSHPLAESELKTLKKTLHSALGHINREFQASDNRPPNTALEANVVIGTTGTASASK